MKLQRKYRCLDCGHRWVKTFTVDPSSPEIVDPPCPQCEHQPAPTPARIAAPSIKTNKSRAVDIAWDIAQQDHGLTNMRDNMCEGDVGYIEPPQPSRAVDPSTIGKPQLIWGGASTNPGQPMPGTEVTLGNARQAAMLAKAEGRSPMELLHKARPKLTAIPLNRESPRR